MSELPPLSETTPRLEPGAVAPPFALPAEGGGEVARSAYRAWRHLVVLLMPQVDLPAREYLGALAAAYQAVAAAGSEVLAVVADRGASAAGLKAAVPFPILLDPDGQVGACYLPDGAVLGAYILDRCGALRHQWVLTAPPLPPVGELVAWLEAIDRMGVS